ncbi:MULTISPECIES: SLC13 family permease [Idiomarina]|uniref:SLC13 family permease n=1 Tax=Idiomarina TaxID=135575 RepID=UPI00129CCD9F|nr:MULTISPECIES: SLC13 family permease [Idiomarina]MRJ42980.1 potassium transporter TrkA [Idiomarina sp. FeN1]NCU58532.1 potassium transporter TrkA [Idiomarina sp. FenA--70]NCU61229.1 potassium transporter TrkA [Idiomarina sp. FenBw--71]UUN12729.1 SLC13 family permease [Idiomarina loihiensis]
MMQAYVGLVIVLLFAGLISNRVRPATLFVIAALALYFPGLLSAQDLLNHYVNQSLVTLMLLLIGSMALERTRALQWVSRNLFHKSQLVTLLRMMGLVSFTSAFLNNTAVVAALMSTVRKNRDHPAQRLLIPLSYFAILGGVLTLIGTSTNLVVNSFLVETGHPGFHFFDFLPIGLGVLAIAGLTTCLAAYLLPSQQVASDISQDYFLDAKVADNSPLIGKTVQQAGLRALDGLFLAEIIRAGNLISPVKPETTLQAKDRLVFCGDVKAAQQVSNLPGVNMFAHEAFSETNGLLKDNLTEVIVSPTSTLVGRTLKEANFRALFDAAVVAIGRGGQRISGKLGLVEIKAGDRLVLAASEDFYRHRNLERNFFVLEGKRLSPTLTGKQEIITMLGFIAIVIGAATQTISLFNGLLGYLGIILATQVISAADIRRRLPLDIWLVIGSALCIADVFISSGLARSVSQTLFSFLGDGQNSVWLAFIAVYTLTWIITEIVTNNAAAAIVFPIAVGIAASLNVDIMPFVMAVAFGASASFISPFGYQTNLMVMNAGNYKFGDFTKIGILVWMAYSASALYLIPKVFGWLEPL